MRIGKLHFILIGIGLILISASFLLIETKFFVVMLILGFTIGSVPFVFSLMKESRISNEKVEMFMEFAKKPR